MNSLIKKLNNHIPLHFSTPARKSAVAVIIYSDNNRYKLILTERSQNLNNHAGEISFPGGTYDLEDKSLFNTIIRETYEEIGLQLFNKHYIGQLNDIWTLTGYLIQPFVFLIKEPINIRPNPDEINSILNIPITFFEEDKNRLHQIINYKNRQLNSFTYTYEGHTIWGATATILATLFS